MTSYGNAVQFHNWQQLKHNGKVWLNNFERIMDMWGKVEGLNGDRRAHGNYAQSLYTHPRAELKG